MVIPLRMKTTDGATYDRPAAIEKAISALMELPPLDLARRSQVVDPVDADYVPSECVLHFVRHPESLQNEEALCGLYVALRQRVLRAVPVRKRRLLGSDKDGEDSVELEIQDAVLGKFQEMICGDRSEYDERLDFYECRFNMAMDRLRATERKRIRSDASRYRSGVSVDESSEPTEELELALRAVRNINDGDGVDFLYRLKLREAINSLPPDERRVIELYYVDEVPIESKDKDAITIVKILGCTEKTVRNRRDRALQRLREAIGEENAL